MCRFTHYTLALAAVSTLAGCPTDADRFGDPDLDFEARLSAFETCDGLREYVTDAWTEQFVGWNSYAVPVMEGGMTDDAAEGSDSSGPTDHSTTNVQEVGVDEPDMIKTDGEYIYALQNNGELIIIDSWPAQDTAVVGRIEVGGYSQSMFLDGDRLITFSHHYDDDWMSRLRATIIDVSDRSNPVVVRKVEFDGYYSDARMIGSDVYIVASHYTAMPNDIWTKIDDAYRGEPYYGSDPQRAAVSRTRMRRAIRPVVEEAVANMSLGELLPEVFDDGAPGELLLDCHEVYRPGGLTTPNLVSVTHLDLAAGEAGSELSATAAMSNGWEVYASNASMYLSATSWNWYWGYEALPPAVTHIHKFDLLGEDTTYAASGKADGWLLNSYSMSEYEGVLRLATTDFTWWWGGQDSEAANNVFTMGQAGAHLVTIGAITGIAPGEQVQSARFQGERGYVVTFEQIDPFFTLDLSNPRDPQLVGELKLPGFSSYLHPIDANNVLAVGQAGDMEGRITGLAVTLFDVSDFANPTVKDQIDFSEDGDWSSSEALWDPHAFTLHRGVMSIPLYHQNWDYNAHFSGLVSIDVDVDAGLYEIGRVDHADLVSDSDCNKVLDSYYNSWGGGGEDIAVESDEEYFDDCRDWAWSATMRRSVVIEDNLYSISDYGVKVTDLFDPTAESARALFYPLQD